ncbi:hypothetical protein [Endozoicomonas sp. GU-1]|uniref:hypothetical protein n=1 Tax=Endozoicomonas sp. GU-1 TaxID=3009078 RepID=UPI0022B41B80|nr:hypothetical protein [Endozoicomonas sp. GU-1]WBA80471.1 hypothetical protein O2T12_19350 [Endozoicomonas sp. GU-1]WBA88036.1 hypothetical protein O3276_08555 [Endozoicomonas sp. GU-1]
MYLTASLSAESTVAFTDSFEGSSLSGKKESIKAGKNSGRVIVKVTNTVLKTTLAKAFQEIDRLTTIDFDNNGNKLQDIRIIDPEKHNKYLFPSTITFDASGKLSDTEVFDKNFKPNTDSINKMCKEALQTMGRKLHWRNCTVEAWCSLIRYPFTSEQTLICNMPWHRDKCTLSMTTLLSPYNQHDNGFCGGALSFAKDSNVSGTLPRSSSGIPEKSTIKTFEYKEQGDGFIFDNINSLHKVKKMYVLNEKKLKEQSVQRLLLVCFTNPSENDVRHLSVALGEENLALV